MISRSGGCLLCSVQPSHEKYAEQWWWGGRDERIEVVAVLCKGYQSQKEIGEGEEKCMADAQYRAISPRLTRGYSTGECYV
mmetsp:Transcript_40170/g.84094  ORF Transcript_40170/g.84094 Transcript_40170/m.84094 type:complete len:81 (+) Transcript_40170:1393-1635(+)